VGLALVSSFGTASATPFVCRWIVPSLLDHTDITSVLHNKSASHGHLCDRTAFLFIVALLDMIFRLYSVFIILKYSYSYYCYITL